VEKFLKRVSLTDAVGSCKKPGPIILNSSFLGNLAHRRVTLEKKISEIETESSSSSICYCVPYVAGSNQLRVLGYKQCFKKVRDVL